MTKSFYVALALFVIAPVVFGQTTGKLSIINGTIDFTTATHTLTVKAGTALPATCTVGELFFKSNSTAGLNLYECQSTNTWTQQSGPVTSVFGLTGAVSPTAHNLSGALTCVAASASTTAYTCSTSPTFTPASGDEILFKADVANTASSTLNVNSSSAATIKKQGGGTNLAANDLLASQWTVLAFDGTNWQMQGQIGNAASAGGSSINLVQSTAVRGSPVTTLAFLNNVTSGNLLIFCGGWEGSTASNPSAVDTVGTTYSVIVGTNGHATSNAACLVGAAGGTGANTITVTWPATSSFEGIYISEWTGLTTTSDGTGSAIASIPSLQITTATAGDLVVMYLNADTSSTTMGCNVGTILLKSATGSDSGIVCFVLQNAAGKISNGSTSTAGTLALVMFALKHS